MTAHAVALSEEVNSTKPLGVAIGEQAIVLWRDAAGIAHALEDRCPHRRAPLSLGCVRGDGNLQCGYHGWSFDGTGKVIDVPQVRNQTKFPAVYRAERFAVAEGGGFVFVALQGEAESVDIPTLPKHGVAHSALDPDRIVELLIDGPQLLLGLPGLRITEYPISDPERSGDRVVYERACRKAGGFFPDRLRDEFPLALRIEIDVARGLCRLTLRDAAYRTTLEATLAITAARRGTTAVRWRADSRHKVPLTLLSPSGAEVHALPRNSSAILTRPAREALPI